MHRYRGIKMIAFRVPDKKKKTLNALIERFVLPGSYILTDGLSTYRELPNERNQYIHRWVNHKKNFVHPNNPAWHSQTVENVNGQLRASLGTFRGSYAMDLQIASFVFSYNNFQKGEKVTVMDKMVQFGKAAHVMYPGVGREPPMEPHWYFTNLKGSMQQYEWPIKLQEGVNIRGRNLVEWGAEEWNWNEEDSDIEGDESQIRQMIGDDEIDNDPWPNEDYPGLEAEEMLNPVPEAVVVDAVENPDDESDEEGDEGVEEAAPVPPLVPARVLETTVEQDIASTSESD